MDQLRSRFAENAIQSPDQSLDERVSTLRQVLGARTVNLRAGETYQEFQSNQPADQAQRFWETVAARACAGVNLPFEIVYPRSLQGTVARAVFDMAHDHFAQLSHMFAEHLFRVWRYVIRMEAVHDARLRPLPDGWDDLGFVAPKAINVDVGRNSQATLAELDAGITTMRDICAARGKDWKEAGGVDTIVDGVAASAAGLIMLAGEKRMIGDGSMVMVHRASSMAFGSSQDIRDRADEVEKIEGSLREIIQTRTEATDEQMEMWFDGKNHWLSASEAVEHGFATMKTEAVQNVLPTTTAQLVMKFNDAPAAAVDALRTQQIQEKEKHTMKTLMKELGLAEAADEAAGIQAVRNIEAERQRLSEKVSNLESDMDAKNAELESYRKQAVDTEVDNAIDAGKISADAREQMQELAMRDLEGFRAIVAAVQVQQADPGQPPLPESSDERFNSGKTPLEQYKAITNSVERAKFYAANRDKILS